MEDYGLYYDTSLMTIRSLDDNDDTAVKRFKTKCFMGSLSLRDRYLFTSLPLLVMLMREDIRMETLADASQSA